MKQLKNIRVYFKAIQGMSVDRQKRMCEAVAEELDLPMAVYEDDERADFVRALRSDELALVARLDVIGRHKTQLERGKRPSVDFVTTLFEIADRSAYALEAESGIRSNQYAKWRECLEAATNRITQGRVLSKKKATSMARKSWKNRRGVVEEWAADDMADQRERWAQHWRDPSYPNAQAAFDDLPSELQKMFGSVSTMYRIFGRRKPDAAASPGRPRKRTKRKP